MSNILCTSMAYAFNKVLGRDAPSSPYLDKLLVKQEARLAELDEKLKDLVYNLYDTPNFRSYRDVKMAIAKVEYDILLQKDKIKRTTNRINQRQIKVGSN